jgi:branched-subunit amino acid ABC-type transport system permease component
MGDLKIRNILRKLGRVSDMLTVLKEALRPLQNYTGVDLRMVIYSLVLILMMLARPKGIFGTSEISDFLSSKKRAKA